MPRALIPMIGQRFGKLVVIAEAPRLRSNVPRYTCQCDCGGRTVGEGAELRRGRKTSCGCKINGPPAPNMDGERFGRLIVLRTGEQSARGPLYECRCDCGTVKAVNGRDLRKGHVNSCGCLRRELTSARMRESPPRLRHGHAKERTRAYQIWRSMVARCSNPNRSDWSYYGGRGITVCDRWRIFEHFLEDMGEPQPGLTIDRINGEGNYEPGNCRWATRATQAANRRRTNRLSVEQEAAIRTRAADRASRRLLAAEHGVSVATIRNIVHR
jgi:hypothetical protein